MSLVVLDASGERVPRPRWAVLAFLASLCDASRDVYLRQMTMLELLAWVAYTDRDGSEATA